jgi:UDP-N-acetylmuramate dehydrogenase
MNQTRIHQNVSLKKYHTFAMEVKADYFVEAQTIEDIINGYQTFPDLPKMFLGGGSNVIFVNDFHGLIIHNKLMGRKILKETSEYVIAKIGAGENWHRLVLWAVSQNLGGIENLALIPGSVGASPVQNIGAYGVEVKDVIQEVEVFNLHTQKLETLTNQDCQFGYRDSIFKRDLKGKVLITNVTFKFNKAKHHTFNTDYKGLSEALESVRQIDVEVVSKAVIKIRQSKLPDPQSHPNSGSFFKNPVVDEDLMKNILANHPNIPSFDLGNNKFKIPAAWLIDQAGLKGVKNETETLGTNPTQPLVLIHYGGATGDELREFIDFIRTTVDNKFGVTLETEVNLV